MLSPLGLAIILLAPVLAGAGMFALTPRILAAKIGASAVVDTYPITGTQASYEVATVLANFGTAYGAAGDVAAQASDQTPASAATLLTVTRSGDSSLAQVGFQAPTEEKAIAGVRAAARFALESVAESDLAKADVTLAATTAEMNRASTDASKDIQAVGKQADYLKQARAQRVTAAGSALADAYVAQARAKAARDAIPAQISEMRVDAFPVSTTSDALRISLAAAMSAFIVATALVLFVRRRHLSTPPQPQGAGRRRRGGPVDPDSFERE